MALELKFLVNDKATPEIKKLQRELNQLKPVINDTDRNMLGLNRAMIKLAGGITSLLIIKDVGQSFLELADKAILLESQLNLVTDSTLEFNSVQKSLFSISQETRQSLESTTNLYARMARATDDMGASNKDLMIATQSVNKALIISGATTAEASSTITQLSQGLASGVLRGEEFNSVAENGSRVAKALSDSLGVTIGELRNMSKEGKLTSEVVFQALIEQSGKLDKEFVQMGITSAQAGVRLSNSFLKASEKINKEFKITETISTEISNMSTMLDNNLDEIIIYAKKVGAVGTLVSNGLKSTLALATTGYLSIALGFENQIEGVSNGLIGFLNDIAQEFTSLMNEVNKYYEFGFAEFKLPEIDEINITGDIQKQIDSLNDSIVKMGVSSEEAWEKLRNGGFDASISVKKTVEDTKNLNSEFKDSKLSVEDIAGSTQLLATSIASAQKEESGLKKAMELTAIVAGAVAVLNQAKGGDPYTAFARMAAMAVSVGSVLSSSGISGGISASSKQASEAKSFRELNSATSSGAVDFDSFKEGLDSATKALEQFGNIGTSIGESIKSMSSLISSYETGIYEAQRRVDIFMPKYANETHSGQEYTQYVEDYNYIKNSTVYLENALEEFDEILKENLADTLDFDKMDFEDILDITKDIDIEGAENLSKELNEIALQAKQAGGELEDYSRAIEILTDANYQTYTDYVDAIDIVNKAMEESKDNIDSWTQRNETLLETTNRLADAQGVSIANTEDELNFMYDKLLQDNLLSDAELELLQTNEDYLISIEEIAEVTDDNISIIENFKNAMKSMSDSIDSTINTIKGSVLDDGVLTDEQIKRLNLTQKAFESSIKTGDTEKAQELLSEINSLSQSVSTGFFGDTSLIGANLIKNLQDNKSLVDFEDEILSVHIVGSDIVETPTGVTTTPSVYVTNTTSNEDRLSALESIMIEVLKTNKSVHTILERIENNGLKAI